MVHSGCLYLYRILHSSFCEEKIKQQQINSSLGVMCVTLIRLPIRM